MIFGTLGIALASGSAAAFNHVLDRRIDERMARTRSRPLPTGHLATNQAVVFASLLGLASMLVLWPTVGRLTALLTFFSLIGYAILYTLWLKRATPQNIVIGGAAGAAPPVLGWAAVTNTIDPHALLLFLIVFTWTPPHFWALAIARRDDYAKAGIPMLPVTHGIPFTRLQIVLYTILLGVATMLPVLSGMSGLIYLVAAIALNARFLYFVLKLNREQHAAAAAADAHVQILHHLFDALVRGTHRRSLSAVRRLTRSNSAGRRPSSRIDCFVAARKRGQSAGEHETRGQSQKANWSRHGSQRISGSLQRRQ